jgi:phenylacetate-CoA ligase
MTKGIDTSLTETQRRKLRSLLADAVANVPWYRREYGRLGLSPQEFSDAGVLAKLPILSKTALLDLPVNERLNSRFDITRLMEESTTGSTGRPFSIYVDHGYRMRRNRRFLRALWSTGYRPWQRLMLLTDRFREPYTRRHGWHYCSVEQPTAAIAEAYLRVRPTTLYGFATPLRLLAEHLERRHPAAPRPARVVTTAEMLTAGMRDGLTRVFRCPVFDFYGLTEMGLVAWQQPGADSYSRAAEIITEFLPENPGSGRRRMVLTNLDLRSCPVIRFDAGDIALVETRNGRSEITGIEGRSIDSILCRDGTELSPYRLTDALRDVPGLKQFKVTQRALTDFIVAVETDAGLRGRAAATIEKILTGLFGAGIELEFEFTDKLIADGTVKFRPVESQVARA